MTSTSDASLPAERGIDRFLARVVHPRLAWRSGHATDRATIVAVYGIGIFYVLRILVLALGRALS